MSNEKDKGSCPFPTEPGAVFMTEAEWAQFKGRLGDEAAYYWCEQAEAYAEEQPRKWAKYKSHFRTLTNWHRYKVENGYEFFNHPQHGPGYYKSWIIEKLAGVRA